MKNKLTALFLCLTMIAPMFSVNVSAFETANEIDTTPAQVLVCKPAEDENYVPYKIMAVLREEYSGLNKFYDASDFPEIPVVEYEALTELSEEDANDPNSVRYYHYNQYVLLTYDEESGLSIGEAMDRLALNPMVEEIHADMIYEIDPIEMQFQEIPQAFNLQNSTLATNNPVWPNDPMYSTNYYAWNKIDLPEAWAYTTGSQSVKVGIIDTGIIDHEDLNANVIAGWDFHNDNSVTNETIYDHGTFVAGIIGAVGNNSKGITGINWNVTMVPLQCNTVVGSINSVAVVKAIEYAQNNDIPIINLSFGSKKYRSEYATALSRYDGLAVCAAGNNGENNDDPNVGHHYPSDYDLDNIISVAATDENDELAIFSAKGSNWGAVSVDLAAPGVNIISTTTQNGYRPDEGTSFAAPMVTGVAAMLLSYNPNLTARQLKEAILNSVDVVPSLEGKVLTGGRLNARKALEYVMKGDKVRSYKVAVSVSQPSYAVQYAEVILKYNTVQSSYYGGVAGELIKNPSAVTCDRSYPISQEMSRARYVYYPSNPNDYIVDAGNGSVLCTMWFDSVFASTDFSFTVQRMRLMDENDVDLPNEYNYTMTKVLAGDVNGDDEITSLDVMLVLQSIDGTMSLTSQQAFAADVNCDSVVDYLDGALIMNYLAGTTNSVRG